MRIGASLLLIAAGAILKFAVTARISGIDVPTVGLVLMIVGIVGLVLTLILLSTRRRTAVVMQPQGTTYVEPPDPGDPRY
jgi:di/tricarboxylate transporter